MFIQMLEPPEICYSIRFFFIFIFFYLKLILACRIIPMARNSIRLKLIPELPPCHNSQGSVRAAYSIQCIYPKGGVRTVSSIADIGIVRSGSLSRLGIQLSIDKPRRPYACARPPSVTDHATQTDFILLLWLRPQGFVFSRHRREIPLALLLPLLRP